MADTTQRIQPDDYTLTTVQNNLATRIDSVDAKASSSKAPSQIELKPELQQVRGAGTAYSIKTPALQVDGDPQSTGGDSVVIGTAPTDKTAQQNANVKIYGNISQTGNFDSVGNISNAGALIVSGSMLVAGSTNLIGPTSVTSANNPVMTISPQTAGAAFYVTNSTRSANTLVVYDSGDVTATGTVTAQSMVSAQGFKQYIPMGLSVRNQTTGSGRAGEYATTSTTGSGAWISINMPMPFAGSVLAIVAQLDALQTNPVTVSVLKNQGLAGVGAWITTTIPNNSTVPTANFKFAKGLYTFAAGDALGFYTQGTPTTGANGIQTYPTYVCRCGLIVEMGA